MRANVTSNNSLSNKLVKRAETMFRQDGAQEEDSHRDQNIFNKIQSTYQVLKSENGKSAATSYASRAFNDIISSFKLKPEQVFFQR